MVVMGIHAVEALLEPLPSRRGYDLHHSFASIAVSGGASLPIIGALLGHTNSATTQRYAHLHDDPLKAASEAVGNTIAASLSDDREGQLIGMDRS